jgi:hypothetical protein
MLRNNLLCVVLAGALVQLADAENLAKEEPGALAGIILGCAAFAAACTAAACFFCGLYVIYYEVLRCSTQRLSRPTHIP